MAGNSQLVREEETSETKVIKLPDIRGYAEPVRPKERYDTGTETDVQPSSDNEPVSYASDISDEDLDNVIEERREEVLKSIMGGRRKTNRKLLTALGFSIATLAGAIYGSKFHTGFEQMGKSVVETVEKYLFSSNYGGE